MYKGEIRRKQTSNVDAIKLISSSLVREREQLLRKCKWVYWSYIHYGDIAEIKTESFNYAKRK